MNTLEALHGIHLLQKLQAKALAELARNSTVIRLEKNESLFRAGETSRGFYGVVSGKILLNFPEGNADDAGKTLAVVDTGEMFCDAMAFLKAEHPVNAIAVTSGEVVLIEQKAYLDLVSHDPAFAVRMFNHLSRAMFKLVHEVRDLKMASSSKRLACFLMHYAPQVESNSFEFTLPLQKQVIASRLNMTPAHLSRALQQLVRDRIIAVKGRRISVLDSNRLQCMAS